MTFLLCKVHVKSFCNHTSHTYETWWEGGDKDYRLFRVRVILTLYPAASLLIFLNFESLRLNVHAKKKKKVYENRYPLFLWIICGIEYIQTSRTRVHS